MKSATIFDVLTSPEISVPRARDPDIQKVWLDAVEGGSSRDRPILPIQDLLQKAFLAVATRREIRVKIPGASLNRVGSQFEIKVACDPVGDGTEVFEVAISSRFPSG